MLTRTVFGLLAVLLTATSSRAQPFDHLQCFDIRDRQPRAQYTVELQPEQAPPFSVAPGCRVLVPARFGCIDVEKRNVDPAPPGAPPGPTAPDYLCYRVRCPRGLPQPDVVDFSDQFGTRPVQIKRSRYLCAPATKVGQPTPIAPTPTLAIFPTLTPTPVGGTATPAGPTPTAAPPTPTATSTPAVTPTPEVFTCGGVFPSCGGTCPLTMACIPLGSTKGDPCICL